MNLYCAASVHSCRASRCMLAGPLSFMLAMYLWSKVDAHSFPYASCHYAELTTRGFATRCIWSDGIWCASSVRPHIASTGRLGICGVLRLYPARADSSTRSRWNLRASYDGMQSSADHHCGSDIHDFLSALPSINHLLLIIATKRASRGMPQKT